jgi:tRNA pseudouridine38-40 synthase
MPRFKLLLEYDGSQYHGWQQNEGVNTVQGEILNACRQLFNTQKIELYGSGRTDAGVHALGQAAHLDVPTQMHPGDIQRRLNELLPYDINILELDKCDGKFHARHSAVARSYLYLISRRRTAFGKKYVWWVKEDLDMGKMLKAASILKGFHDFASFGVKTKEDKSTLVDVSHINIRESGNLILIHIIGSHFLWMMVRRIAGVITHAGKGKLTPAEIQGFLESHTERPSQLAAPPSGLYLQKIYYPGEPFEFDPPSPFVI